jgi:hypothetical protein
LRRIHRGIRPHGIECVFYATILRNVAGGQPFFPRNPAVSTSNRVPYRRFSHSCCRYPRGVVRDDHSGPHSVGIFDETSDVKPGDQTPGVPRQRPWCGSVGTTANGIVTVHLAYARDGFPCRLDGELDLPKSWSDDRGRCRAAGLPDAGL